jgi:hypothetical protein
MDTARARSTGGAAAALTISAADLDGMRRLAAAPPRAPVSAADEAERARRDALRAASAARAEAWPNTLLGLRRQKAADRAARLAAAEDAALKLDAETQEARLNERLKVLRAANAYFEGQSDKVKALRNFRQRVDDAESNAANGALRAARAAALAGADAEFFAEKEAERAAGEAADAARRAGAKERARVVAAELTAQVKGAIARRRDENEAERLRGLAVAADAKAQAEEERAAAAAKVAAAAASQRAFAAETAADIARRAARADENIALEEIVAAQVAKKEWTTRTIAGVLARQREEKEEKARVITGLVRPPAKRPRARPRPRAPAPRAPAP